MEAIKIKPLFDRIIVKAQPVEEKTAGGLFIPERARETLPLGTIVAAGDGAFNSDGTRVPMQVKVGDVVYYGEHAGAPLKFEGVEYLAMNVADLLGVKE